MSIVHQFALNVVTQGLARVVSIGANIVLLIVVARSMGTAFFGQFSYVLAFSTIAIALADLGTTAVLARGLSQHDDKRAAYLGNFLLMRIALTLFVMAGGCAAAFATTGTLLSALLIIVAGLPVLATRFFEPIFQVYGKPWLSLRSNMVFGAAQLLLALVVWAKPDVSIALLTAGIVVTNVVYTVAALTMMLRIVKPDFRPHRELMRNVLLVAAPLGVASIFTTIILRADVIILAHMRGDVEVGLYSAAYRVLDLAVFVAITAITPLIPILTDQIRRDRKGALVYCRMAAQFAAVFALPAAIVAPTIGPSILTTLLGPDFVGAAAPLNVLVLNFVLIVFALLGSSINLANGEVTHAYWNAPLACLINLALNFLLIPRMGMVGAAWATTGSQLVMLLVSQYYLASRFGNVYEPGVWFRIFVACAVMWGSLQLTQAAGPWGAAAVSLAVYFIAIFCLGLFPRQIIEAVIEERTRRRLRASA